MKLRITASHVSNKNAVNSVCCFLMGLQAGALGEALPTQRALVGLLAAVDHRVSDEVALFGEAPAALQAAEGFLPRVTPQVLFELTEPRAAFVAVRAAEPLLAHAGPPGRPHPPWQAKAAAAVPAEGSGCCVWRRRVLVWVPRVRRRVSVLMLWLLGSRALIRGVNLRQSVVSFIWLWSLTSKRSGSSFHPC